MVWSMHDGVLPEGIDNDGDGYVECSFDVDGWDGDLAVIGGDDCSDADGTVFVSQTYYIDAMLRFGTPKAQMNARNNLRYVLNSDDCNDDDANVYLNAQNFVMPV